MIEIVIENYDDSYIIKNSGMFKIPETGEILTLDFGEKIEKFLVKKISILYTVIDDKHSIQKKISIYVGNITKNQ